MNKNRIIGYLIFLILTISNVTNAQQGCDLNAIRAAFTSAGCTELSSCQTTCSMYFYNPQNLSGSAAQNFAQNLGANLVSIQSGAENTCIGSSLVANSLNDYVFIGLTDETLEGTFVWLDDEPLGYSNWASGEPNDNGGDEDCVQIFPDGSWNDLPCSGLNSASVIEVSLCPQITASNDTTICNGTSANLVCDNTTFGSAPFTYSWSDGQTGQAITVSPTVTTTYTVTSTDRYGCFVTEDIIVTVVDNVTPSFTSSSYCVYDSVLFTDNSTVTSPDVLTVLGWDFGDGSAQQMGSQLYHDYTTAGTYVVSHGVTTANGCVGLVVNNITVYNAPSAQFSVPTTCANVPVNFSEASTPNGTITTWNWVYGDGIGTSTSQNDDYTYLNGGSFDVELSIIDDNGCKDTLVQTITINNQPQAQFTFVSGGCLYDTVYFTDASTINSPDNIAAWNWDVENDEVIDYTTANANHLYTSAGDFDVTLNVVSNNGCQHSITQTVTVGAVPQVGFSASTVCVNGAPTTFVNTSTISFGTNALFGWSFGDGGVSTNENPTHDYSIAASYPVTLRVISDLGCIDSVTYSVDVLGKPTADFAQDAIAECAPMCVNFIDQSFDDIQIDHWSWKFENNFGESLEQHPNHCFLNDGTYDISLIIRNVQGCKDTVEKVGLITAFPQPFSDFTFTPESTDVLSPEIEFTNNSVDAVAWSWNFNDGTDENLTDYDPVHSFGDTGHFEVALIVFNNTLCSDTSYHIVEILPVDEVFVPSAFSPNGDGKNDVLYARGYIGEMYFAVYDRLGKKVFESTSKENGWNGMINGKQALAGVYSWYLQAVVNEVEHKLKGDVTLVR